MQYKIILNERQLHLQRLGPTNVVIRLRDSTPHVSYSVVFPALQEAVSAVCKEEGWTYQDGSCNWEAMRHAFSAGKIRLEIEGEVRESRVAEFYLRWEFDIPAGLFVIPNSGDSESVYETYNLRHDLAPIENLARKWNSRDALLSKLSDEMGDYNTNPESRIRVKDFRFKIAVLGQTGAGKSTFINALLGRPVMPVHGDICTGAILRIHFAATKSEEKLEVRYISTSQFREIVSDLSSVISPIELQRLKAATKSHDREKAERALAQLTDIEERRDRLVGIKRAWEDRPQSFKLDELERFVSITNGNFLPELVSQVDLYLNHPFLRYVSLFDTPGLGDPDIRRRRKALEALKDVDGWLYLTMAALKDNTTVFDDLKMIREDIHVHQGAVVLSKADQIAASDWITLKTRQRAYGANSDVPIEACSARALEDFVQAQSSEPDAKRRYLKGIIDEGFGLQHLRRHTPQPTRVDDFDDPVITSFKRKIVGLLKSNQKEDWDFVRDVLLESSGVIGAVRSLTKLLNEKLTDGLVQRGLHEIRHEAGVRIRLLSGIHSRLIEEIATCEDLSKTKSLIAERESLHNVLEKKLKERKNEIQGAKARHVSRFAEIERGLRAFHLERLRELPGVVRQIAKSKYTWTMSGKREVELFEVYDRPVANRASKLLQEFADQLERDIKVLADNVADYRFAKGNSRGLVEEVLTGYTFHAEGHELRSEDEEKFFESYDDTIERLVNSSQKLCESRYTSIESQARRLWYLITEAFEKELQGGLQEVRLQLQASKTEIDKLREHLADLANNVTGTKEALLVRKSKVAADIALLKDFEESL